MLKTTTLIAKIRLLFYIFCEKKGYMMQRYDFIENQRPMLVEYTKRGHMTKSMPLPHVHNSYEIYYLLEGERYYFIHNTTYHVKKGMLVLIDPSVIHRTISTGRPDHERLLINIQKRN